VRSREPLTVAGDAQTCAAGATEPGRRDPAVLTRPGRAGAVARAAHRRGRRANLRRWRDPAVL